MSLEFTQALAILFGVSARNIYSSLPGLVGGSIAIVTGLIATVSGLRDLNSWWRLWTTTSVSIREAIETDAVVQTQGPVRKPQTIEPHVSPIRGEECVAYEYKIYRQVQGTGDPTLDSGTDCVPFILSDGTDKIYVDPTMDSFSVKKETSTVTGREQLLAEVDTDRLDIEASALGAKSGLIESPIELAEWTISIDEPITVMGKATPAPDRDAADAVITPTNGHLTVANDSPETATLRTGARGFFLLVLGTILGIIGLGALTANVPEFINAIHPVKVVSQLSICTVALCPAHQLSDILFQQQTVSMTDRMGVY